MAQTTSGDKASFKIQAESIDGPSKEALLQHWQKAQKEGGFSDDDWQYQALEFIQNAKASGLQPLAFVARDDEGNIIGAIHCQIWAGPIPWVVQSQVFRLGTLWGLSIEESNSKSPALEDAMRKALLDAALTHLSQAQCFKVVTLAPTESEKEAIIQSGVGFQEGNMLTLDLLRNEDWKQEFTKKHDYTCVPVCEEHDATVCSHWRLMWQDVGIPPDALLPNMEQVTSTFIKQARERLNYQTFLARCTVTQKIAGSVSCQVWEGPIPQVVKTDAFQLGTLWAVYVDPAFRRQGIATALMKLALQHLHDVGCDGAILVAASKGGQCVYERLGFRPNNALVCDLQKPTEAPPKSQVEEEKKQEERPTPNGAVHQDMRQALRGRLDVAADSLQAKALCTATTQQLVAVYGGLPNGMPIVEAVTSVQKKHGIYIDPQDNWFTQRLARAKERSFGQGFDMNQLSDAGVLASKFDRLAPRYDHWTVGNRSKVESFIVDCVRRASEVLSQSTGRDARVLDIACGIGLQGQVLRLCGFQGELVGTDISSGMVQRVMERGCYNQAYVTDANQNLAGSENSIANPSLFDVVVCTGAMELLDHQKVLAQVSKMTRPGGEIWVSFQHGTSKENPTQHQNVQGISREHAVDLLSKAGFRCAYIEACPDAFYTPSPAQDGTLLPVPYLFILATKEA